MSSPPILPSIQRIGRGSQQGPQNHVAAHG
jgi:hypothetical protein